MDRSRGLNAIKNNAYAWILLMDADDGSTPIRLAHKDVALDSIRTRLNTVTNCELWNVRLNPLSKRRLTTSDAIIGGRVVVVSLKAMREKAAANI